MTRSSALPPRTAKLLSPPSATTLLVIAVPFQILLAVQLRSPWLPLLALLFTALYPLTWHRHYNGPHRHRFPVLHSLTILGYLSASACQFSLLILPLLEKYR